MFVAHAAGGYCLYRALFRRASARLYAAAAIVGSVFPDVDIFWFYLVDGRSTTHHLYWTHLPIYWALIGATGAGLLWLLRARRGAAILLTFAAGVFVHLLLDSIAGGIYWLWPLSSRSLVIAPPAPQYDWWVWNFVFHWTFLFEFLLIGIALIIWRRGRRRRSNGQQGRAVGILDRSCEATR